MKNSAEPRGNLLFCFNSSSLYFDFHATFFQMISQLKLIKEDPEQADTEDQVKKHEQTIKTLEELLMLRYNEATLKILKARYLILL